MQPRPPSRRRSVFLFSAGLLASLAAGCASGGSSPGSGGSGAPGTGGRGSGGSTVGPGTGGGTVGPGTGGGTVGPGSGGNTVGPGTGGGTVGPGTGGTGTTGTGGGSAGGAGASRACPVAGVDVISDFEEGSGVMVKQGGRTGFWYTYADTCPTPPPASYTCSTTGPGMQTPPKPPGATPEKIAVEASGDTNPCNKWAFHSTASNHPAFVGFGSTFVPLPASDLKSAYDVSAYTGISFKIKSGGGTPPAVYFEVLTKDSQPSNLGGTATAMTVDLNNNRGHMLMTPSIPANISQTWQTITVPFGTLIPRWVPAVGGGAMGCPATTGGPKCQAPKFNPANVLGMQFSVYPDPGFPKPSGSTPGTYDLWVDDLTFVKADAGLPPGGPPDTAGVGACTKPSGPSVAGKFLAPAYSQWKQTFVTGGKVIRPENGNDTVSEGIAYGMLIAVNMNDKTLFDSFYSFWKSNNAYRGPGGGPGLMTWCLPSGGGSCNPNGGGSATDADEDAAYALLQAGKVFSQASYTADAKLLIADIWAKEIDPASHLPTGGSNYGNSTTGRPTNASYFAPSHYRAFKAAGDTNDWDSVITAVYGVINGGISGTNGLIPAWCVNNCSAPGSNGAATDTIYQYDSHRIPMRIGLDYCFGGAAAAAAKTYTDKTTRFFATSASAGLNGIGRIFDLYTLNGNAPGMGEGPNSASIIGTASVGAMASSAGNAQYKAFLDDGYQAVFDMVTRGNLAPLSTTGKTPYSYYNATVGMLTLLIMTGNFSH